MHGGSIKVQPRYPRGTRFMINASCDESSWLDTGGRLPTGQAEPADEVDRDGITCFQGAKFVAAGPATYLYRYNTKANGRCSDQNRTLCCY